MLAHNTQDDFRFPAANSRTATATTGLSLRIFRRLDELDALRPGWDRLLNSYPQATTFCSWEWLTSWWRSFGGTDALLVLAAFDSQNELAGLAPLAVSRQSFGAFPSVRILRFMADGTFDSDNLDMPVRPGFERLFAQVLFRYLKASRSEWDVCELNTLPLSSSLIPFLANGCTTQKWPYFEHCTESAAIYLPGSWDEYVDSLSNEDGKNIGRYTRRLNSRYHVRISRCTQHEEIPACLDALFRLHQHRWEEVGEKGSFSSPERRAFYKDLSRHLIDRGWLELWSLELDGRIGAVQFAFRFRDRVFQLQEGYDSERSSDRLGVVLRAHVLRRLIAEGVRVYDFLGGENSYKKRWAAQPGQYRTLRFAVPFSRGSALLRLVEGASQRKRWLRQRMPVPAWTMLQRIRHFARGYANNPAYRAAPLKAS
jgi:CelD/BcsL family acetyltransferase involved in cellulose biosynthesis